MNLHKNNSKRQKNCNNLTSFDYLQLLATLKYFRMMKDISCRRIESSQMVADMFFGKSGASYHARTIRDWSDYYLRHSELPLLGQGKYQKTKSLIDDEDVKLVCLSFSRSLPAEQRTAVTFGLRPNIHADFANACSFRKIWGFAGKAATISPCAS